MRSTAPAPSFAACPLSPPPVPSPLTCWVITDGKPGMENQCLGLAEALGLTPEIKRVRQRNPWRALSPWLRLGKRFASTPESSPLLPPWPDLVIATGRHSILSALSVRQRSRRRSFLVQIQNPVISPRHFDLVVVPRHDGIRPRSNVWVSRGALHRVTPEKLAEGARRFAAAYAHLPRPRFAVLVGGDNGPYRLTPTIMGDFAEGLAGMARATGGSLMVTPSRRTGADNEAILRAHLRGVRAEIWDGQGENPYFGMLGLADAIVVTCDSVSMISEACSTGKPVYLVMLDGDSPKFRRFHQGLEADGLLRPFSGNFAPWTPPALDDTAQVAAEVRRRLAARFPHLLEIPTP